MLPFERSLSLAEAETRVLGFVAELGLTANIEVAGENFCTARCWLISPTGTMVDSGLGKGSRLEAVVGAIFEALEHWLNRPENLDTGHISSVSAATFARAPFLSPIVQSLFEGASGELAVREYVNLASPAERIKVPVALSCPALVDSGVSSKVVWTDAFDYGSLGRYCTNSGVAIGSNWEEAAIHGLLEAVEREALSSLLVDVFHRRDWTALRPVTRESRPEMVAVAEEECNGPISVWELRNPFGVPAFAATLDTADFPVCLSGFGASLDSEWAMRRSLAELAQCYHNFAELAPEAYITKARTLVERFRSHPFHRRCYQMQLSEAATALGDDPVEFQPITWGGKGLSDYLEAIVSKLKSTSRAAYTSCVHLAPRGPVVLHTFLERHEHTFCIVEGSYVMPNLVEPGKAA